MGRKIEEKKEKLNEVKEPAKTSTCESCIYILRTECLMWNARGDYVH
jgi:hypothetical protein